MFSLELVWGKLKLKMDIADRSRTLVRVFALYCWFFYAIASTEVSETDGQIHALLRCIDLGLGIDICTRSFFKRMIFSVNRCWQQVLLDVRGEAIFDDCIAGFSYIMFSPCID
jgi:hypothetical protein